MGRLFQRYHSVLYATARLSGLDGEAAQDAVQGFFLELIRQDYLEAFDRDLGGLRSFTLKLFRRFLSKERAKTKAWKRGGRCQMISLEDQPEGGAAALQVADWRTPAAELDHRQLVEIVENALLRVRKEYQLKGKGALFNALRPSLQGEVGSAHYVKVSRRMQVPTPTLRVEVHRIRRRLRVLVVAGLLDGALSHGVRPLSGGLPLAIA